MANRRVYLDHNATTPLHPEVSQAMIAAMAVFGNPSSMHGFGRQARDLVEEARERVAAFINAAPDEIVFVGSGSEGNNTVLSMLTCQARECEFKGAHVSEIVTTTIEHPCILETSRCLSKQGVMVTYVPVDRYGGVDFDQLNIKLLHRSEGGYLKALRLSFYRTARIVENIHRRCSFNR